ncbi:MAG: hypothetical protein AAB414_01110 [Patescibacteria group bacterium]
MAVENSINAIPHAERIAMVSRIQKTIPRESIRIQEVVGKPNEMWGFVCLPLPHIFRAGPSHKGLTFIRNGMNMTTEWGFVHAPYRPSNFHPPLFTESITEEDMRYMLRRLRVGRRKIELAAEDEEIPLLYRAVLGKKGNVYDEFNSRYFSDRILRAAYGTAVSIVCDEKMTQVYPSS